MMPGTTTTPGDPRGRGPVVQGAAGDSSMAFREPRQFFLPRDEGAEILGIGRHGDLRPGIALATSGPGRPSGSGRSHSCTWWSALSSSRRCCGRPPTGVEYQRCGAGTRKPTREVRADGGRIVADATEVPVDELVGAVRTNPVSVRARSPPPIARTVISSGLASSRPSPPDTPLRGSWRRGPGCDPGRARCPVRARGRLDGRRPREGADQAGQPVEHALGSRGARAFRRSAWPRRRSNRTSNRGSRTPGDLPGHEAAPGVARMSTSNPGALAAAVDEPVRVLPAGPSEGRVIQVRTSHLRMPGHVPDESGLSVGTTRGSSRWSLDDQQGGPVPHGPSGRAGRRRRRGGRRGSRSGAGRDAGVRPATDEGP